MSSLQFEVNVGAGIVTQLVKSKLAMPVSMSVLTSVQQLLPFSVQFLLTKIYGKTKDESLDTWALDNVCDA